MALQKFLLIVAFAIFSCKLVKAQESEFLPQLDVYIKLNANFRLRAEASNTREGGDPTQPAVGPYLDFYAKPLIRLRKVTAYELDEAKARPLVLAAGYNFIDPPGSPSTNRMILTATSHLPIQPGLLLSDRNRADIDWSNGKFDWRYRNKLEVEKPVAIHSYHPTPYVSVEVYYESQYQKWSTTEIYGGCLFPIKKHFELDPYYEHQNNTGKSPNNQLHGFGLTLNVFLPAK